MDWSKAKNIIIAALLIANLMIGGNLLAQRNMERQQIRQQAADPGAFLEQAGITIDADVPQEAERMPVIFLRLRFDWRWALGCFAVTGLLGLLLLPTKVPAILYGVFFGYYPLVKLSAERIESPVWRWVLKLACFNAAMIAVYVPFRTALPANQGPLSAFPALMLLCANGAFVVYDLALRQGILYYLRHISGRMK